MANRKNTAADEWVKENTGKHFCKCGCGGVIPVKRKHFWGILPQWIKGHGTKGKKFIRTADECFWPFVLKTDGCWIWTGTVSKNGYPVVSIGNKLHYAHRYSYELHFGVLGKDFCCHKCDVPQCVRPDHLFRGNAQANMDDCKNKNRVPRGMQRKNCRLSDDDVREIRTMLHNGVPRDSVASVFCISRRHVYDIMTGRRRFYVE